MEVLWRSFSAVWRLQWKQCWLGKLTCIIICIEWVPKGPLKKLNFVLVVWNYGSGNMNNLDLSLIFIYFKNAQNRPLILKISLSLLQKLKTGKFMCFTWKKSELAIGLEVSIFGKISRFPNLQNVLTISINMKRILFFTEHPGKHIVCLY